MKRIVRILVLAVAFVLGMTTVSAQSVRVELIQKVPVLPSTVTSYMDDPFRYFTVQFNVSGAGHSGLDVFFDMEFTVDTHPELFVGTDPNTIPLQPIHLSNGPNFIKPEALQTQVRNRIKTQGVDFSQPVNALQLPEGEYQLCESVYRWSDRLDPNRVPISDGHCNYFRICYSGSAPELVSPMAGAHLALNGAMVVNPSRKISFLWTPVISNCAGNTRFSYQLKVVKVLEGQNYQDAIKYNPTVFSAEVSNNTHIVFDTLRDIKVQMEKGAFYVAQVKAKPINTRSIATPFVIANDGNSQPMPFFWGTDEELAKAGDYAALYSRAYNVYMEDGDDEEGFEEEGVDGLTQWEGSVEEVSGLTAIANEMKEPYLAGFIQDDVTIASLTEAYPDERNYVPTPKRRYIMSDGYYTVPATEDVEVVFMPVRHESIQKASYQISVYANVEGGLDSITAQEPVLSEKTETLPEHYNKMDSHELVSRTLKGWGQLLEQGKIYYLQLSSFFTVGYWDYSIADTCYYVNGLLAEHTCDTVSREWVEDELIASNGVFFQWGDNPKAPGYTTPQWTAPVNRSGDDIHDPLNYVLPAKVPEVSKTAAFPVAWTAVKKEASGDKVEYEVKVYELKKGQTLEEAVSKNKVVVSRTLTDVNEISGQDADFFKAFSPQKTYVMTLGTHVSSENHIYHFVNGNNALPIVFKIVR